MTTVLRIKRKRSEAPMDALLVETAAGRVAPQSRGQIDLSPETLAALRRPKMYRIQRTIAAGQLDADPRAALAALADSQMVSQEGLVATGPAPEALSELRFSAAGPDALINAVDHRNATDAPARSANVSVHGNVILVDVSRAQSAEAPPLDALFDQARTAATLGAPQAGRIPISTPALRQLRPGSNALVTVVDHSDDDAAPAADDYVYDLYCLESAAEKLAPAGALIGRVVWDSAGEMLFDGVGGELARSNSDSCGSETDSNAESFCANEYPDEGIDVFRAAGDSDSADGYSSDASDQWDACQREGGYADVDAYNLDSVAPETLAALRRLQLYDRAATLKQTTGGTSSS